MPTKPKEATNNAQAISREPSSSKASKKSASKGATSKPREQFVYVVVCSYSFSYDDYRDEAVKVIGAYASIHDANSKVIDLWRSPEELNCGLLYREKAKDGIEKDGKVTIHLSSTQSTDNFWSIGSRWWYHEHCGGTSVCIEKFDMEKEGGDRLVVKNGSSGNVDLVEGLGGSLNIIKSSGEKAQTWGRNGTNRPKQRALGPATYPDRVHRVDVSELQAQAEPGRENPPKLYEATRTLKSVLGVQTVNNEWKWQVEWENEAETSW